MTPTDVAGRQNNDITILRRLKCRAVADYNLTCTQGYSRLASIPAAYSGHILDNPRLLGHGVHATAINIYLCLEVYGGNSSAISAARTWISLSESCVLFWLLV